MKRQLVWAVANENNDKRNAMQSSSQKPAPLKLPPPPQGWWHITTVTLGVLLFAAMLVLACIYTAPALVSDWQVHNGAQPAANARVSDGKCSAKLIIHICDMTVSVRTDAGTVARRINYVFTDVHVGSYSVRAMVNPTHPELATTDMALDRLWNRTITLVLGAIMLMIFVALPVTSLFRQWRTRSDVAV